MRSEEEELTEMEKQCAAKRKAVEAKHRVMRLLPYEGYEEPFVFYSKLHGTVGTVHFRNCNYETLRRGKDPDRDLPATLLDQFPPLPLYLVKDGAESTPISSPSGSTRSSVITVLH